MHERLSEALDRLAADDWQGAHDIAQGDPSPEGAWLHAHLHRIEGDEANAVYWYSRAGQDAFALPADEEFEALRRAAQGGA